MYFSPRKFLISTIVPVSWMTTLMGKWAYTERILYRKPCSQSEAIETLITTGNGDPIKFSNKSWHEAIQPHTKKKKSELQYTLTPNGGREELAAKRWQKAESSSWHKYSRTQSWPQTPNKLKRNLTKVTPLIMFWTWLQMVRTVASSFLFPHHLSTRSWGRRHSDSIHNHLIDTEPMNLC